VIWMPDQAVDRFIQKIQRLVLFPESVVRSIKS
jgi:hypothetical protein